MLSLRLVYQPNTPHSAVIFNKWSNYPLPNISSIRAWWVRELSCTLHLHCIVLVSPHRPPPPLPHTHTQLYILPAVLPKTVEEGGIVGEWEIWRSVGWWKKHISLVIILITVMEETGPVAMFWAEPQSQSYLLAGRWEERQVLPHWLNSSVSHWRWLWQHHNITT